MNAAGPVVPLEEHLATARRVAGHDGPVVAASPDWLAAQGVQEWAGERSLPLWINTPGWEGFGARDTSRALASGLSTRPLEETLADTLVLGRCAAGRAGRGAPGCRRARSGRCLPSPPGSPEAQGRTSMRSIIRTQKTSRGK